MLNIEKIYDEYLNEISTSKLYFIELYLNQFWYLRQLLTLAYFFLYNWLALYSLSRRDEQLDVDVNIRCNLLLWWITSEMLLVFFSNLHCSTFFYPEENIWTILIAWLLSLRYCFQSRLHDFANKVHVVYYNAKFAIKKMGTRVHEYGDQRLSAKFFIFNIMTLLDDNSH